LAIVAKSGRTEPPRANKNSKAAPKVSQKKRDAEGEPAPKRKNWTTQQNQMMMLKWQQHFPSKN
jgi:hypothetical protein